jgi:hypothetical protein
MVRDDIPDISISTFFGSVYNACIGGYLNTEQPSNETVL